MNSPHLERARLLMGQDRYNEAKAELTHALSQEPNDGETHAMLAISGMKNVRRPGLRGKQKKSPPLS